jgi:ribosomal protein L22
MAGKKPTEGQEPEEEQQEPAAKAPKAAAKAAPEPEAAQDAEAPKAAAKAAPEPEAAQNAEAPKAAAKAAQESDAAEASAEKAPAAEKKPRRSRAKKPAADAVSEDAPGAAEEEQTEAAQEKRAAAPQEKPRPHAPYEGPVRVVRAHARHVRTSARKARLVCDHLRGKSVEEARAILAFNPRGAARDWSKVLESAIANAENNHELIAEDLVVAEAFADEGPTIKRFQPRARGRASSIRKRTSHLTIALAPERR